ncbi:MAG TPA: hypothetical protein VNV63_04345, partial [Nitrospiria bacterium]|nr:hypothetical protein [Nitrospiria bacterium]
ARGVGVVETLARICKLVLQKVKRSLETLAPGWDEDPVTKFVRSKEAMQPTVIEGLWSRRGESAVEKEEKALRHRDIFGRSWM